MTKIVFFFGLYGIYLKKICALFCINRFAVQRSKVSVPVSMRNPLEIQQFSLTCICKDMRHDQPGGLTLLPINIMNLHRFLNVRISSVFIF